MKRTTILITIDHEDDISGDKFWIGAMNAILHGDNSIQNMKHQGMHFSHKTIELHTIRPNIKENIEENAQKNIKDKLLSKG